MSFHLCHLSVNMMEDRLTLHPLSSNPAVQALSSAFFRIGSMQRRSATFLLSWKPGVIQASLASRPQASALREASALGTLRQLVPPLPSALEPPFICVLPPFVTFVPEESSC